jgi:hypothetical protein
MHIMINKLCNSILKKVNVTPRVYIGLAGLLFISLMSYAEDSLPQTAPHLDVDASVENLEIHIKNENIKKAEIEKRENTPIKNTMRTLSRSVQKVTTEMDGFFSREETEIEDTGTRVKLAFINVYEEYEDPTYNFLFNLRLMLPHTQDKLQLLLESDESDEDSNELNTELSANDSTAEASVKDQKVGLGLRGLFHKSNRSAIVLDGGIKIKDPLDPFIKLTLRKTFQISEIQSLRFYEQLYWYESTGLGSFSSIEWDYILTNEWLFRFGHEFVWRKEPSQVVSDGGDLWSFNHYISWTHKVTTDWSMRYALGLTSDDDPTIAVDTYYLRLTSRYAFLKPWYFFDVVPGVSWLRDTDWEPVSSILFKVETIF